MPMVDLFVLKDGQKWRNRGLNSVPTAHCWESVGRAAAGVLTVSAYAEEEVEGSMTDSMWGALAEKIPISEAFTGERSEAVDAWFGLAVSGSDVGVSKAYCCTEGTSPALHVVWQWRGILVARPYLLIRFC